MDKAIEIKRRAQRCILNGDLDGALAEYEKLVALGDPDPYYCVLLADLLYKMGNAVDAQRRYLEAIEGYSRAGLFKNGIAVCKKLSRLSLAPIEVPRWLAKLYALDGLGTEAGLAYQQLADVLIKHDRFAEAREALQQAIQGSPESARLYERLGEIQVLAGDNEAAGGAWSDAAERFERAGQEADVRRCRSRIAQLQLAGTPDDTAAPAPKPTGTPAPTPIVAEIPFAPSAAVPLEWAAPPMGELEFGSAAVPEAAPASGASDLEAGQAEVDAPLALSTGLDSFASGNYELDRGDSAPQEVEDDDEAMAPPAEREAPAPRHPVHHELEESATAAAPAVPPAAGFSLAGLDTDSYGVSEPESNGALATVPAEGPAVEQSSSVPAWPLESNAIATPEAVVMQEAVATPSPAMAIPDTAPSPAATSDAGTAPIAGSGLGIQRFGDDSTPSRPGLGSQANTDEVAATEAEDPGLAQVSLMLAEAQTCFHSGDREGATRALIRAAQGYDQLGRFDSAVAIYRSLGQSPDVSLQLMMLWLKNCQRRDDRREAARVACDLGDRALNDGDVPAARDWFERARSYDAENEIANRRLKALEPGQEDGLVTTQVANPAGKTGAAAIVGVAGHLNVRTHRDEPVLVDLGVLIEEFQRAIGPELASDPQGHYDLGMSYREMGLVEQAVDSLRVAAAVPAFRLRAGELAGRCLLDLGRFDEAAEMLRRTLQAPDLPPSAAVDLRYQLALALEAAGQSPEALTEFERVYAAQANYPDVAMKIRLLRKTTGAG